MMRTWIGGIVIFSGLLTIGFSGFGFYRQIVRGHQFGNNPMSDTGMIMEFIIVVILYLSIYLLFRFARLTTEIDVKGITYRYYPFHFKHHTVHWDEIERYEVIKYHPLRDYGGWGIRFCKGGKAFNVAGDRGLQLYLKTGKRILIGTQKDKELADFLAGLTHPQGVGTTATVNGG
ncbi:MAG: hypothetical protein JW913_05745 [Chitinispirillaceae bacterium]|nr:hypothetical protein [Chitinispirillaceae bacterium]